MTDGHGSDKSEMVVSPPIWSVRCPLLLTPTLPSRTGAGARSVDENSPPGTDVGKPVAANDAVGDTLTYTLAGTDGDDYRINPATGQITVGPRTTQGRSHEDNASDSVTVTATDPAGGATPVTVTITIDDVNEAPMINEGFTRNSQPEYDTDDETGDSGVTTAKDG